MQNIPRFNILPKSIKEDNVDVIQLNVKQPLASSTMKINGNCNTNDIKLGFANLPEQMQRKAVKKGFNFTLMIVGESGLGKSTFVNSLLNQSIYTNSKNFNADELLNSTTKIEKHFIELDEKGVKLRLTIVDTPGFGDGVDCRDCWRPIVDYVDETFYQYFKEECAINRKNIQDNRVHCCLYFISPTGHGVKSVDIECMKVLHHKVNIVPIIAKADSLTENELKNFKMKVINDLAKHEINFYQPPICGSDEEDEFKVQDAEIRSSLPFSVIGSNAVVENENGRKSRGRQYCWGIAEVENSRHCNFNILRTFVLRTHMQDLKDVTNDLLYENYRGDLIQVRMNRRNNDRYATMNSTKTESTISSSIDDIVDSTSLVLHHHHQDREDDMDRLHITKDISNDTHTYSPVVSHKSSSTVSSAK